MRYNVFFVDILFYLFLNPLRYHARKILKLKASEANNRSVSRLIKTLIDASWHRSMNEN